MARPLTTIWALGLALASACTSSTGNEITQPIVESVVDGDTVVLDFGSTTETVRLLGIDTPETVHPTLPEQCFGAEATQALTQLLPPGTPIRVERDTQARDHFGRLLLYLYRADDDLFVNEWLLDNGLGDTSFYEPNTAYQVRLTQARLTAQTESKGLWASCDGPDQPID